jgi:AbrB family looped-hinge helix DNA binding protein
LPWRARRFRRKRRSGIEHVQPLASCVRPHDAPCEGSHEAVGPDRCACVINIDRSGATVILSGMTQRVGAKGQIVIPKNLRDRLGIVPGDEVECALDEAGQAVRVEPVRDRPTLRGSLAGLGLVTELKADHRSEASR